MEYYLLVLILFLLAPIRDCRSITVNVRSKGSTSDGIITRGQFPSVEKAYGEAELFSAHDEEHFPCRLRPISDKEIIADCSNLQLHHIPACPVRLRHFVIQLNLACNRFGSLNNTSFISYPNLIKLDLSNNKLQSIQPRAFFGLGKLQDLDLTESFENQFLGTLPKDLFAPLRNMTSLKIYAVPKGLPRDSLLKVLCGVPSSLTNLTFSLIHYPPWKDTWVIDRKFGKCLSHTKLKFLQLYHDRIFFVRPGGLPFLHLGEINLRKNYIRGTKDALVQVLQMPNLTKINIGCQIGWLHCSTWVNVTVDLYEYFQPDSQRSHTDPSMRPEYELESFLPLQFQPDLRKRLSDTNMRPEKKLQSILSTTEKRREYKGKRIIINVLSKLKYLIMDNTLGKGLHLDFKKYDIYWNNTSLEILDMERFLNIKINGTIPLIGNLRYLNLRGAGILLLDYRAFWGSPGLETILLGGALPEGYFNSLGSHVLFRKCKNLTLLDLSYNEISNLPSAILKGLNKIQRLDLGYNRISHVNIELKDKTALRYLDLRWNNIVVISKTFCLDLQALHYAKLQKNMTKELEIDIRGNPLNCSCDNINMISLLLDIGVNFTGFHVNVSRSGYLSCKMGDGSKTSVQSAILEMKNKCRTMNYERLPFILYLTSLIFIFFISIGINRRYIALYTWYTLKFWILSNKKPEEEERYKYDAFIVHKNEDVYWILNELLPNLGVNEGSYVCDIQKNRYEFCFDLKDFIPGMYIIENVIKCLSSSRHCILFVTKNFLKSGWCLMESVMAHAHFTRNRRQGLIVVAHPKVLRLRARGLIPPIFETLFETVTYIEWPKMRDGRHIFWLKLEKALGNPVNS